MLAVLGRSWALCWRSWVALGPYVGGLVPLLGLCWRSCAALGAYVGGLGPLLGPKLAARAALGASEGGLGTGSGRKAAQSWKSGPNPSGSRVQTGSGPPNPPRPPVRLPIFSIEICIVLCVHLHVTYKLCLRLMCVTYFCFIF